MDVFNDESHYHTDYPKLFNVMVGMIKHNAEGNKASIEEHLVVTIRYLPYVQSRDIDIARNTTRIKG